MLAVTCLRFSAFSVTCRLSCSKYCCGHTVMIVGDDLGIFIIVLPPSNYFRLVFYHAWHSIDHSNVYVITALRLLKARTCNSSVVQPVTLYDWYIMSAVKTEQRVCMSTGTCQKTASAAMATRRFEHTQTRSSPSVTHRVIVFY